MPMNESFLAFDLGAGSGRAFLGCIDNRKLVAEEIHRFENKPVRLKGALYWDFFHIWNNILEALSLCSSRGSPELAGIGIDSWNLDFGLIDQEGRLIWNPVSYRDQRGEQVKEEIASRISNLELYQETGIPVFPITGLSRLFQLSSSNARGILDVARCYLPIPDLVRYFLTDEPSIEETISWGTQLVNIHTRTWSERLIRGFDIPKRILPKLVPAGEVVGSLSDEAINITGLKRCPVVTVAEHDTITAVFVAHQLDQEAAILSAGTWSIIGAVIETPNVSEEALEYEFMNELAFESIFFAKNSMGFYILEELLKIWRTRGIDCSYSALTELAQAAPAGDLRIDPNDALFFSPANAEDALKQYFTKTKQKYSEDIGAVIRAIYEGLAASYAISLGQLGLLLEKRFDRVVLVGGGARNNFFSQLVSDACSVRVLTGPAEATVIGNLCFQALSLGAIRREHLEAILKSSCEVQTFRSARSQPLY